MKCIHCKIVWHSVNVPEEFNFRDCLLTRAVWDFFTCGNYHRSLICLMIWCVLKLWLQCVFMACIFRAVNECYFQWFHVQHLTDVGMGKYNPIPRRLLWTKQPWTQGFLNWEVQRVCCYSGLWMTTMSFLLFNVILCYLLTEKCLDGKLFSYPN